MDPIKIKNFSKSSHEVDLKASYNLGRKYLQAMYLTND